MTEPRRLIEICTFPVANEMVVGSDDLAKLIAEAEERAKAAQIADLSATEPNPTEKPTRTVLQWRLGGRASGWF